MQELLAARQQYADKVQDAQIAGSSAMPRGRIEVGYGARGGGNSKKPYGYHGEFSPRGCGVDRENL